MSVSPVMALVIGLMGALIAVYQSRSRRSRGAVAFDPAAYGLVPREVLDAGRAGPPQPAHRLQEMQAVADAAWGGDWRAAAAYVAAAGDDWDARWTRTEVLQEIACEGKGEGWLQKWRSVEPENADAATLQASLLLHRAWQIRGSGYAHEVLDSDMNRFKAMLPQAMSAAVDASKLDPRNPGPWVVMLTAARAMSYSHKQFRALWGELTARAPYHYAGHWQALQYWCGKWHGSDRLMLAFAKGAVGRAPAGSPLAGIYLHALQELDKRGGLGGIWAHGSRAVLERVARSFEQVSPEDEALPRLRHLLAHYLLKEGGHEAALEQFRLIGRWCGAHPWTEAEDPVAAFDYARSVAAARAKPRAGSRGTATMPL